MSELDPKNIEITLKTQSEEESYLDFSAVGSRLKRLKGLAVKLLAAAVVIGLAAGVMKHTVLAEREVQTLVTFGFDGIERGVDPHGAVFDISKMSAPVVVQLALDELGLSETISADQVRKAMTFEGVVPQDALDRISIIQTVAEKTPAALEELLDVSYHPVEFRVTLELGQLNLNNNTGKQLLDAISTQYKIWFMETYSHYEALGTAVGSVDYGAYDYLEAADMLKVQLDAADRYVAAMQNEAPNFRSTATNLTFADLNSTLDAIRTVDMAKINSLIIVNQLTKDANTMKAYYSYQIRTTTNSLAEAQERLATIEKSITSYEKNTSVIYGADGLAPTTITNDSSAYDNLFSRQISASNEVSALRARLSELEQNYNALVNADPTTEVNPNAPQLVEELLTSIPQKLNQCMEQINATAWDYYETVAYKNAFRVQIPAQNVGAGLVSMAIDSVLYAAVLAAAACVLVGGMAFVQTMVSGDLYVNGRTGKKESSVSQKEHAMR